MGDIKRFNFYLDGEIVTVSKYYPGWGDATSYNVNWFNMDSEFKTTSLTGNSKEEQKEAWYQVVGKLSKMQERRGNGANSRHMGR